jgi:hypothetical protein
MRKNKFTRIVIGLFLSIGFISCSNDDTEETTIQPSTTLIEMEAEGGDTEITFTNGDWNISKVINKEGNVNIAGDIYSQNGEITQKNTTLVLNNLGKIVANWKNKGFTITRETSSSLKIELNENSTGESFNFALVLNSGQEINVIQKKSEGYKFSSIKFSIKEEDGDSLFIQKGTTYNFNIQEPNSFTFSPYSGITIQNQSRFKSLKEDAFTWLEKDSIKTPVPTSIYNNEIYFGGEKRLYSNIWSINPVVFEEMETVAIPKGESSFSTEIELRKRQVSYTIRLINNRTAKEKIIEGKWIEIAQTGKYSIQWQD